MPADRFDSQMEWLAASGRVVPLARALEDLATVGGSRTVEDRIVVTFDDGTADFADVAAPIAARHGIPVTLYLATAFVEERRPYDDGAVPVSWDGLADVCADGLVDVGSHTHRHLLLDRLDPAEIAMELDRSVGLIRDRFGARRTRFRVPEGRAGLARCRDRRAGPISIGRPGGDASQSARAHGPVPTRRARPCRSATERRWFERKAGGGMVLEDTMRVQLNRIRYAAARS